MDKIFITANDLLEDSFRLAQQIYDSGFRPDYIVGIWRGGAPVGIAVQEYLEYRGLQTDHIAIRTSAYRGSDRKPGDVRVHGLEYIIDHIDADDKLLIIDDVFDTGLSIQAVLNELAKKCRRNIPTEIKIATVYHKPEKKRVEITPDYVQHQTDRWLIFPHEIQGLTLEEIEQSKPAALRHLLSPNNEST